MKKTSSFLLAFLFASAVFCMAEEPAKNELPAKESPPEKANDDNLVVSLTFLPVSSFDDDNNQRMSEKLAAVFLQEAISQYFKTQKEVDPAKAKRDEKKKTAQEWSLTYTVPPGAISAGNGESVPVAVEVIKKYYPTETVNSSLHESKALFVRDLKIAEALFFGQITGGKKISEERITNAFNAFEKKVKADDSMFLTDKDGLLSQAKSIREFLLKKKAEQNTASAQTFQPDESSAKTASAGEKKVSGAAQTQSAAITKANMLPEYEPLLMSDPILLENGGWCMFQTADGSMYLVAVGMAAVKNDSAQDRVQRQKIAEMNAYSELAKLPGMDVKTISEHLVSETAKNDQVEVIDSFQSKVTTRAEEYLMGLPTVGTWYSPDGKVFFLAKGKKI